MNVLVVDDNEDFCANIKDLLEMNGYDSTCVTDGFAAVSRVKVAPPDFILMDARMPGKDGLATFREVKQIAPKAQVIMVSAYTLDDTVIQAIKEGAIAAFGKPLDFPRLLKVIEGNREAV